MNRIISFLILLINTLFIFSCSDNKEYSKTENIQVIPKNAAIIVEGRNLKKTRELVTEVEFSKLFTENNEFSSLYNSINQLNKSLEKNGASIWMSKDYSMSLHTTGSKEFGHLFIIDDIREDAIKSIKKAFPNNELKEEQYENQTILHLKKFNLNFVQVEQFFILSTSEILIKDAIRQHAAKTDLPSDVHFKEAFKVADRSEFCNIYIQTKEMISIFEMTYKSSFSFLKDIDEWLALDLNIDSERILLSGISTAKEDNRLHKLMFGTKGQKSKIFEYLPSNTHFFVAKMFPDIEQYMTSRIKTLEHEQRLKSWKTYKKEIKYNAEDFLKTIGNNYTYAICGSELNSKNAVGYVQLKDLKNAKKYLTISDIPKYRNFDFRELSDNTFLDYILGDHFKDFKDSKCIIIDDYAIFSNEISNLKSIINDYLSGNTLANQKSFNGLKNELSSKSNIWFYISEDALNGFPEQMARDKFKKQQSEVGKKIKNLGKILAQVKIEDNYFKINIVAKNPKKEWESPKLKTEWSLELENAFDMTPQKLWNHVDSKYEIAIQDKGNILYLISDIGKVLWKKQLDEKIIGTIKQIDIYKNKRFQMLIQTKTKLLLLDRNGEMVHGYPINLPSSSTGELAVFDYDKNRNYRILVPCSNHFPMYSQTGQLISGWKAYEQDSPIIKKPQHFSINSNDYILTENESHNIMVLKRNGNTRFKLSEKVHSNNKSQFINVSDSEIAFQVLNEANELIEFNENGEIKNIESFDKNVKDLIIFNETKALLKSEELEVINPENSYDTDLDINTKNIHFNNYKDELFSIVDKEKEKVYIFNNKAKILDQFPIYGSTNLLMSNMNNGNTLNLYIGASDGTLYSYQVSPN